MPQLTRGNCRETRDKFYGMEPLNMQLPYKRSMPRLHAFKKSGDFLQDESLDLVFML